MFVSIKKIIPAISERLGFRSETGIHQIKKEWPKIVETLPKREKGGIDPLSLREGILTVKCPNPVWANELILHREQLLKKINKITKESSVKKIKFVYH